MTRAEEIINANRESLDRLASALLEREILDSEDIDKAIKGEELPPFIKPNGDGTNKPQTLPLPVQGQTTTASQTDVVGTK